MATNEYNVVDVARANGHPQFSPLAEGAAEYDMTQILDMVIQKVQRGGASETDNTKKAFGGSLYFPAGHYYCSNTIFSGVWSGNNYDRSQITCRGDGIGGTVIRCMSSGTVSGPIFRAQGRLSTGEPARGFCLKDMTLDGRGRSVLWLDFNLASNICLDHLEIVNTPTTVLYGRQWTDSVIHDVLFKNVGGSETAGNVPVVLLEARTQTDDATKKATACTQLKFQASRFEGLKNIAIRLREKSRSNFIQSCYFASISPNADCPQIWMEDNYILSVIGSRFEGGYYQIRGDNSSGLIVLASSFDDSRAAGIYGVELKKCSISGNTFLNYLGQTEHGPTGDNVYNMVINNTPPDQYSNTLWSLGEP